MPSTCHMPYAMRFNTLRDRRRLLCTGFKSWLDKRSDDDPRQSLRLRLGVGRRRVTLVLRCAHEMRLMWQLRAYLELYLGFRIGSGRP